MNTIKKSVLLFIALLLVSISVSAISFELEFEEVDNTITFGQLIEYNLKIRNNRETTETFKVRTLDSPEWEVKTDPYINPIQFKIGPDKQREIPIFISPNPSYITNYGVYDVTVLVELIGRKEKKETALRVNIVSPQAGVYIETVLATIIMDDQVDASKGIPIRITLNNQNIIEYPEIIVKVESSLINEEIKESLGKKEKKTISLTPTIDPQTPAQEDTLVVTLTANNKTLDTKVKRIEIIEHKELAKEVESKRRFLKTIDEITLTNVGNIQYTDGIKVESSLTQTLFTSSRPKGRFIKEDGKRYLEIPVDLAPGESTVIQVTKNYITLLIIVALIAIIIGLYYIFRSPLTIRKKARKVLDLTKNK